MNDRSARAAAEALGWVLRPLPASEHPAGVGELAKVRLGAALEGPERDALLWELSAP